MNKAERFVKSLVDQKLELLAIVNKIIEKTNPTNKATTKMPPEYVQALKKFHFNV